jgi:two-component sensor histidine kinase
MRTLLSTILFFILLPATYGQTHSPATDSLRLNQLLKTSHADSARKDYLSALKHLSQFYHLKDSMLKAASKRQLNQLNKQYQTASKDQQIQLGEKNINLLTTQNRLMTQNLQQAKSIRNIIMVVAIVAALLLALSYYQYRIKKKVNLRLQLQQKAISQKNDLLQQTAGQKDILLDEKELLIKEIHHRVKNNLQVVISLLNTQSAYLNDPQASAAIRQSQHRMQSISLIHQKLYQSESRALINMPDYTRELVQYLQQSFDTAGRITFKLDIADIELDVLRAVPVGLIMNEAITNAIKYAFPLGNGGCITVELSSNYSGDLKLSVTDDGIGLPPGFNIDLCKSLGINLIKGMCRQISGQLAMQGKNGLVVAIEFPMKHEFSLAVPDDEISSLGDNPQMA